MGTEGTIQSQTDFSDDPRGWAQRWQSELSAAREALKDWHKQADEVSKRYLGELEDKSRARLNLFSSDIDTREALLYGQTPKVDASRRYADAEDDVARVSAEMQERLLNGDIERDGDGFAKAARLALKDWLIVDCGNLRARYVARFETVPEVPAQVDPMTGLEVAPAVPAHEVKSWEDVETDYAHWRDQLWPSCRTFGEAPWWAFKADMTRDEFGEKFGEEVAKLVPAKVKRGSLKDQPPAAAAAENDPWARVEVWEIWEKAGRRVWFYVEGYGEVVTPVGVEANENGSIPDPLGLDGFWPFPEPLISNANNDALVPLPMFVRSQDLYNEIDELEVRIHLLTQAIAVRGLYDQSNGSIQRLVSQTAENVLIPVDNWAAFAEKGGMKGQVDWLPLDQIVGAIDKLTQKQGEKIALLYQVTGMSDIMRGQAAASATATEQAAKVRFGNIRTQRMQDRFAEFLSQAQRIRAEIIAKHFDPQTIVQRSNMQHTPDAPLAMQAAELLKDDFAKYRIQVASESVAQTDFAALKQERGEFMAALSGFMQAAPMFAQAMGPAGMPTLLELVKWALAGLRGSSTIEGTIDRAIEQAKQAAMQPKPPQQDPRMALAMAKGQMDLAKGKLDIQAKQAETQAKVIGAQADIAKTRMQMQATAQKAALGPVEEGHFWGRNKELAE